MNEQQISDLYRASSAPGCLDPQAEQQLAAALLGGDGADREAGLDLLARLPQGPQLARVMQALAPDADRLGRELAARRAATAPRRRVATLLAMAASVAAVAVLVGTLRSGPPEPQPAASIATVASEQDRILVASFEPTADAATEPSTGIFRGDFDS